MDHSQKSIDWWLQNSQVIFSYFAIVVGLGSLIALFIGFMVLTRQRDESEKILKEMKALKEKSLSEAEEFSKKLRMMEPDQVRNPTEKAEINDAAKSSTVSTETKLHALALQAVEQKEWSEAVSHWKSLIALYPKEEKLHFNIGYALQMQGESESGLDSVKLLRLACKEYAAMVKFQPDNDRAYYNWGNALVGQARATNGIEAEKLFAESYEKYAAAAKIKPDNQKAHNNWGNALLDQAKSKQGQEADKLFEQAQARLLEAEKILTGSASYNLACLSALKGKQDECKTWLEKCEKCKMLPDCGHLRIDKDLEIVRESNWFKELLARNCG